MFLYKVRRAANIGFFGLITVFAHRAGWGSDNFKYTKGKFRPTFYEHYFIIIDKKKNDSEEDYTQ